MKKLLILLSFLLIVACNPNKGSSKGNFPSPSVSVSNPGNVDWGSDSTNLPSTIKPTVTSSDKGSTPIVPSSSTSSEQKESTPSTESSNPSTSTPSQSSSSMSSSSQKESSSSSSSSQKESSSSSSEKTPSNVLPGEGFGGLH